MTLRPDGATAGRPRRRWRLVLWCAVILLPALMAVIWFADWRGRLARTHLPTARRSGELFAEADSLLHLAVDVSLGTLQASDSTRVLLGSGLATLFAVADQLEDIQQALELSRRPLLQLVERSHAGGGPVDSTGPRSGEAWVYDNLALGADRQAFVPQARSADAEALRGWANRRREARQQGLSTEVPLPLPPLLPLGPDTILTAAEALEAATLREAALTAGLVGDPLRALALLESVGAPYAGAFVFGDPKVEERDGWRLQLLRYPDLHFPGDIAVLLRRAAIKMLADSIWTSLIPRDQVFDALYGDPYDPAPVEAYLRWSLARAAAARGDGAWFVRHRRELSTGPFLFHHWVRLLAREVAGIHLAEPEGPTPSVADQIAAEDPAGLRLLDSLALAEPLGPTAARRLPHDPIRVRERLESILENHIQPSSNVYADYLVPARAIALAYAQTDYVVGQWRDLAPEVPSMEIPTQDRWRYLLRARVRAAQAIGMLSALAETEAHQVGGISDQLEIWNDFPWNIGAGGSHAGVQLVYYVPGLLSDYHVVILATQGEHRDRSIRSNRS